MYERTLLTHTFFKVIHPKYYKHLKEAAELFGQKKLAGFWQKGFYSHPSNNRGGGAKVAKSINVEVGINVEGGIFWKKLVYKCNKRGVEGGKNLKNQ